MKMHEVRAMMDELKSDPANWTDKQLELFAQKLVENGVPIYSEFLEELGVNPNSDFNYNEREKAENEYDEKYGELVRTIRDSIPDDEDIEWSDLYYGISLE